MTMMTWLHGCNRRTLDQLEGIADTGAFARRT